MMYHARKLPYALFLSLLLLVACGAPAPTPGAVAIATIQPFTPAPGPTTPAPTDPPAAAEGFDAQRALAHVQMLAVTIGSRVAGTPDGYRAGDYIAGQFAAAGLEVTRQEFPFQSWLDLGSRASVTGPSPRDLKALSLQGSPSGQVEAPLVAVGGVGDTSDFAAVDVRGCVVLVARGVLPFSTKAINAAGAGASAVLIYNDAAGDFSGTLRDPVSIPAMALSRETGQQLLEQLKGGSVRVRVESNTRSGELVGRNIIGVRRGDPNRSLVFGGHYDSVQAGPGANDNASGTAVLLELARALAGSPRPETLVFIAFDGEESGLLGSKYYVAHLPDAAKTQIEAMLNFDMLAGGSGPLLIGGGGNIAAQARRAAVQTHIDNRNFQLPPNSGSDHAPFEAAGLDTVFFSRDYALLHTPRDTIQEVRVEWLEEAGRVAYRTIGGLPG